MGLQQACKGIKYIQTYVSLYYVSVEGEKRRFKSKYVTHACNVIQTEPLVIFLAIVFEKPTYK